MSVFEMGKSSETISRRDLDMTRKRLRHSLDNLSDLLNRYSDLPSRLGAAWMRTFYLRSHTLGFFPACLDPENRTEDDALVDALPAQWELIRAALNEPGTIDQLVDALVVEIHVHYWGIVASSVSVKD